MKLFLIFAAILAVLPGCGSTTGPEGGPGGETTYTVDGFSFTWQQHELSSDSLWITISAPTTGWIAVGFRPTQFMLDANLIICYVENGLAYASDDFGTGAITHVPDIDLGGTFDIRHLSGTENSTETSVSFCIAYDSGDQYDRALADGQTYTFIFAYGADGADDFTSSHVWAKSASFEL